MSLVDNSYRSAFPAVPLNRATASGAAGAATPAAPGKPRPFLDGVFKTACNYCVRCGICLHDCFVGWRIYAWALIEG